MGIDTGSARSNYDKAAGLAEMAAEIAPALGAEPDLAALATLELTIALAQVHAQLAVADAMREERIDYKVADNTADFPGAVPFTIAPGGSQWIRVEFFGLVPPLQVMKDVDPEKIGGVLGRAFGFTHIDCLTLAVANREAGR